MCIPVALAPFFSEDFVVVLRSFDIVSGRTNSQYQELIGTWDSQDKNYLSLKQRKSKFVQFLIHKTFGIAVSFLDLPDHSTNVAIVLCSDLSNEQLFVPVFTLVSGAGYCELRSSCWWYVPIFGVKVLTSQVLALLLHFAEWANLFLRRMCRLMIMLELRSNFGWLLRCNRPPSPPFPWFVPMTRKWGGLLQITCLPHTQNKLVWHDGYYFHE